MKYRSKENSDEIALEHLELMYLSMLTISNSNCLCNCSIAIGQKMIAAGWVQM